MIMSTLHPDVEIPSDNDHKKNQRLFYSIIKQADVDVIDQMAGNTL